MKVPRDTRTDYPAHRFKSEPPSATVAGAIRAFSEERRNTVRGVVADSQRARLQFHQVDALRKNTLESDMIAAATILEASQGLLRRKVLGLKQVDIAPSHNLETRSSALEAAYACGFLNVWPEQSIEAIETLRRLACLAYLPLEGALDTLTQAAEDWGASNYLARKIAYVKEFFELDDKSQDRLDGIDTLLGHREHPQIQYSALELLKDKIPLFSLARRYTNIFKSQGGADFRREVHLDNLVATPFSPADCGGFLLRSVQTSLLDTAFSILVLINLEDRFPGVAESIRRNLAPHLLDRFTHLREALSKCPTPDLLMLDAGAEAIKDIDHEDRENRSLSLYRRSISFLEHPSICKYRNDIDCVIGRRLIAPLLPDFTGWCGSSFNDSSVLRRPDADFELALHDGECVKVDIFYRTYLFLRFIQDSANLAGLSTSDIQYIFDKTVGLESLLLESELKTMHLNASDDARPLISVLALSLYRSKSSDPDVDFDFREQLEQFITSQFSGNVASFIESLAPNSPAVAGYIATSLDETTLQKMYSIVKSPARAETIRRQILTTVGTRLNKIEYIMEAEAIETRSKVSSLKDYFDSSRMFVDSLNMKKWLSSHPSAYTEQYKELLPRIMARLSRARAITATGEEATIEILEFTRTDEYLIQRIAEDGFREFCVNNEFGIESYLGRRIRHNTLHGVMTNRIDAVLTRPVYHPVISGTPFGRALAAWESSYKVLIERMRRDFLQFRSDSKPHALFHAKLDPEEVASRRNLQQLVQTLRLSGADMLYDLVIAFCWKQISPQLENASRQIRVTMAQQVVQGLDQALSRFGGNEEQKVKSELSDAVSAAFAQVASWFQVPQTGFVPASISDICNIIDIEHNRQASMTIVAGESPGITYYGITVHRIYDCLAALLQNAFKHGRRGPPVTVYVQSSPIPGTSLHTLGLTVSSSLPASGAERCLARVDEAVTSTETGRDMVTEGYSGIKKVKFITKMNEGQSTVSYDLDGAEIMISFSMKAEVISEEGGDEAHTAR